MTLSRRGHVDEIAVHRDVRGMPHGILRNLVAALQKPFPLSCARRAQRQPRRPRTAIDALGNSGSPAGLPAIRTALQSPSPVVPAAAVSALRHIRGEEADRLVATTLQTDAVDFVRSVAAGTVRKREYSPFSSSAVVTALGADEAASVRMALVDVVAGWLGLEPTLKAVLEATAKKRRQPRPPHGCSQRADARSGGPGVIPGRNCCQERRGLRH